MTSYLGVVQPSTDYPTFDNNNSDYNYRNLNEKLPIYELYQEMAYHAKPVDPLKDDSITNRDPTNLPCDIRPTYLSFGEMSRRHNYQQTIDNNPNFFFHKTPAQSGYFSQNGDTYHNKLKHIRPISLIQKGIESSIVDYHGYIIDMSGK